MTAFEDIYTRIIARCAAEKAAGGGPSIQVGPLEVTENGTYEAEEGSAFNPVSVDVKPKLAGLQAVTNHHTYRPMSGVDGYSSVTVNVTPRTIPLSVTSNGTYQVPSDCDGYGQVDVNVPAPQPATMQLYADANGEYYPPAGTYYDYVNIAVPEEGGKTAASLFVPDSQEYTQLTFADDTASMYDIREKWTNRDTGKPWPVKETGQSFMPGARICIKGQATDWDTGNVIPFAIWGELGNYMDQGYQAEAQLTAYHGFSTASDTAGDLAVVGSLMEGIGMATEDGLYTITIESSTTP